MADMKHVEEQLKRIGCNYRFWGRAELKELANVLLPGEVIEHCVNGQYEGGFALLAATDQRVLLIDKKPMYLTLEDVRFDMIAEVDYNHRLMNATIFVCTPNKNLRFTAFNRDRLRKLFHFVQTRVMEIRQHYMNQAQPQTQSQPTYGSFVPGQAQSMAGSSSFLQFHQLQQQPDVQFSSPQQATQQQTQQAPVYRRMAPILNAYTRMPMMTRITSQRRFLGSRAMNTPIPSATLHQ